MEHCVNTQLTVDFRAVSHAKYFYVNQWGEQIRCLPTKPSVHGAVQTDPSRIALAEKLGIIDSWTAHCVLQLRNNHSLRFVGAKAKQMFAAYNAHIYGKK